MKYLGKVKKLYLVKRINQSEVEKPIHEEVITDEDLVPLELLDIIMSKRSMKQDKRKQILVNLLHGA